MSDVAANIHKPAATQSAAEPIWSRDRRRAANFWREFMFFWTEHYPNAVRWTRPMFLWFAWRFSPDLRHALCANARRLLGPAARNAAVEALAKETLRNAYMTVYEVGRSLQLSVRQLRRRIDGIEGKDRYLAVREQRRGAILLTAHLGSFELGTVALLDQEERIHVVFQRDEFARFERLRKRLHEKLGVSEAPVDEGWPMWVRLRDALRRNEVVMVQGDRVMPGQRGAAVPFRNGHILMPTGPIKLALATAAPIIPVFSIRTGVHRARVIIDEPIDVSAPSGSGSGTSIADALHAVARAIEKQVVAHPQQWMRLEPVWCEDRDGAADERR